MAIYRSVRVLTAIDAAYIAGLVDGEGTITLTRYHKNENRRLVVCISNNERPLLEFVLNSVGAGRITTKRTYRDTHAPSFTYAITNRQAFDLLIQLAPHLRSYKSLRATFVLQNYIRLTPRNGKYKLSEQQERERFEGELLAIRPPRAEEIVQPYLRETPEAVVRVGS
jgi:hypothetical protein